MVSEVESILVEIREHVRAEEHEKRQAASRANPQSIIAEFPDSRPVPANEDTEALARISAHLTTTARAWDRLPPLVSSRTGASARFELWLKAKFKKLSRWFTWEQINFNSAVHHALADAERTLSAQARELASLRVVHANESESWRAKLEQERAQKDKEFEALRSIIDEQAIQRAQAQVAEQSARAAIETHLSELANELRERDEQLSAEQRVSFKQLSLEVGEAVVLEDSGRRAIESRLRKLEETRDSH